MLGESPLVVHATEDLLRLGAPETEILARPVGGRKLTDSRSRFTAETSSSERCRFREARIAFDSPTARSDFPWLVIISWGTLTSVAISSVSREPRVPLPSKQILNGQGLFYDRAH